MKFHLYNSPTSPLKNESDTYMCTCELNTKTFNINLLQLIAVLKKLTMYSLATLNCKHFDFVKNHN